MEQLVREIEIECLPKDIPDEITIDVSGLKIGESLHTEDLLLDKAIKVLLHPKEAIVSIIPPRKEEEKIAIKEEKEEVAVEEEMKE